MSPTIYNHADSEGSIQIGPECGCPSLINDADTAERAGAELGHALLNELLALRGNPQADALRAIHDKLQALGKLAPFDRAAGGFAVALVNVLEVGVATLPKVEGRK